MFLFNLFTTDDRVAQNIIRINKNRVEPELNMLMLEYKYKTGSVKEQVANKIFALANEHGFNNHKYLGLTIVKNNIGTYDFIN